MKKLNTIVLCLALVIVSFFVLKDFSSFSLFECLVSLLNILPFGVLLFCHSKTIMGVRAYSLTVSVIVTLHALYEYVNSSYINPDAQSALIFLFLPIYLLLEILFFIILYKILIRRLESSHR